MFEPSLKAATSLMDDIQGFHVILALKISYKKIFVYIFIRYMNQILIAGQFFHMPGKNYFTFHF